MCQEANQSSNITFNNAVVVSARDTTISSSSISRNISTTSNVGNNEQQQNNNNFSSTTTFSSTRIAANDFANSGNTSTHRRSIRQPLALRQRARTLSATTISTPSRIVLQQIASAEELPTSEFEFRHRTNKKRRLSSVDFFRDENALLQSHQTVLLVTQTSARDLYLVDETSSSTNSTSSAKDLLCQSSNKSYINSSSSNKESRKKSVTSVLSDTVFEKATGPLLDQRSCSCFFQQRKHSLKSLIMASLSTFGLVVLLGNCFMFVLGGGGNNTTMFNANNTFFEPQTLLWSNQQHGSLRGSSSITAAFTFNSGGKIELDAYGRPSENQLRREVLRNLSMEHFKNFVTNGHEYTKGKIKKSNHPNNNDSEKDKRESRKLNSIDKVHKLSSSTATDHALQSTTTSTMSKKMKSKDVFGVKVHGNDAEFFKATTKQKTSTTAQGSSPGGTVKDNADADASAAVAVSSSTSSQQPSQFSEVDEAVESLTLELELSRNRRIAKRIGCHWVLGKEASSLEESRKTPTLSSEEGLEERVDEDHNGIIEVRDAKQRHLRNTGVDQILASKVQRTSSKNDENPTNKKKTNDYSPSDHKPHIILHHEDGETRAWDQQRR